VNHIIYDLEWDENGKREIIEIGATKLAVIDGVLTIVDNYQSFVCPTKHEYTDFCERFTGIPRTTVEAANKFPEVLDEFIAWIGPEEHTFCVWGNSDKGIFHRNCHMHNINIENWMSNGNDIQIQITKLLGFEKHQRLSLKRAIGLLDIEHDGGSYHRADFDAKGAAKVMMRFFDKLELHLNVKGGKPLKRKTNANIESFVFNDRKQMAAWMEGRLDPILDEVPAPIREDILKDVTRWEDAIDILKYECLKIFNSEETQEMTMRDEKVFYEWVKNTHPDNSFILLALKHGYDSDRDSMWRKHLFMRTFHFKNQKVS
jgi:inhibitor of KinA sporulation pathway (predicted exonuclease)